MLRLGPPSLLDMLETLETLAMITKRRKPSKGQLYAAKDKDAALNKARQDSLALMLRDCPPDERIGAWKSYLTQRAQGDDLARVMAYHAALDAQREHESECVRKGLAWRSPNSGFQFYTEKEL